MKNKKLAYLIVVIISTVILSGCSKIEQPQKINKDIITTESFAVNADSVGLNTFARGTIFIKEADDATKHVQIVSEIQIDEKDWYGVGFYIPKEWIIKDISTNFYDDKGVYIWETYSDRYKWNKIIRIERTESDIVSTNDMEVIVIDLIVDENKIEEDLFDITIAVGSQEKNGMRITETDSVSIDILLNNE